MVGNGTMATAEGEARQLLLVDCGSDRPKDLTRQRSYCVVKLMENSVLQRYIRYGVVLIP